VLFDKRYAFDAVAALSDDVDFGESFQQENEFVASGLFVVDDDGGDGHGAMAGYEYRRSPSGQAIYRKKLPASHAK
jgi:hypothetical protein